jgi:hypothetical protein
MPKLHYFGKRDFCNRTFFGNSNPPAKIRLETIRPWPTTRLSDKGRL